MDVVREPEDGLEGSTFEFHRALVSWGEGAGVPDPLHPGRGFPAQPGEACWTHRFAGTGLTSSAPGGVLGTDFALPMLQANFEASVFRIATLLAEPAGPILARMTQGAGQPTPNRGTATGTPADLLRNRPDIRAAERDLAAATAAIGVAEAELYPSLRLSGFVSEGDEEDWSFGPSLRLPVLNQGLLAARRNEAVARAEEAELIWRQEVLTAVEEVQTSDSALRYWRSQVGAQRAASDAAEEVRTLTRKTYEAGGTVLTDVLDAERRALDNRLVLMAGLRDLSKSWIQLQVATGRGWSDTPPPAED